MKLGVRAALLAAGVLVLSTGGSLAATDQQACQDTYKTTIKGCAQNLDSLAAALRPGAQKACVLNAKIAKDACMNGPSPCATTCQSSYDAGVAACEVTYDPTICGDNLSCQIFVTQERADCISMAVDVLDACTAACATP